MELAGHSLSEGVWLEFVAAPCGERYTMPLGVMGSGGAWRFRLYPGVGLLSIAESRGWRLDLRLLTPLDPLAYMESYLHRLEERLSYRGGCPEPDPALGSWYACPAVKEGVEEGAVWFRCRSLSPLASAPQHPYYRAYGCFVELLIAATKAKAGFREYLGLELGVLGRSLYACVEKSAPGRRDLVEAAKLALQDLLQAVGEA
ncbi:hypothetical protein apy_00640 [Aeropyrum pernix]|uniref:DUF447 family protein n=1 Tax=Aeropyrum pernix TaxID=56636 RepID=A0A401H7P6_AERPX|nr:hypothetical protein apy_00640 [Aeropyrum pernix]